VPFEANVKVGGMIEIPAAVLAMGAFLRKLDFLSIGTNDLIQYTLAVDRSDDAVSHLYDPLHPAVLRLIGLAIAGATKAKVPIAVCGEMAGDLQLTRLLLGLGLRGFEALQQFGVRQSRNDRGMPGGGGIVSEPAEIEHRGLVQLPLAPLVDEGLARRAGDALGAPLTELHLERVAGRQLHDQESD
jgi:hypothetical protein